MNKKYVLAATALATFVLAAAVYSQETLASLTTQLQKTPTDNALREKIIKLAASLKPLPEIPEEARRQFIRGNTAIKNASSPDDYINVIKLYQEAALLAPWWADAYFNLAKSQELHQEYDAAIQSLKFYLLTSPADARDAQDHIYALEELRDKKAASDKANSPEAKAAKEKDDAKKELTELLRSLDGSVFAQSWETSGGGFRRRAKAKIQGDQIALGFDLLNANGGRVFGPETALGEVFSTLARVVKLDAFKISPGKTGCSKGEEDTKLSIDKNGKSMTWTVCDDAYLLLRQ